MGAPDTAGYRRGVVSPDRLVVAGKLLVDEVLELAAAPLPGTQQRAAAARRTGGGQVWHTARAAARAGAAVTVTGLAGADADGEELRAALRALGVRDRLVAAGASPRAVVLVPAGQERAIVSIGGSGALAGDALPSDVLDGCGWVHVDGYAMDDVAGDAVLSLAAAAWARGIPVSLEPPSLAGLASRRDRLRRLPPLELLVGRPEEVVAVAPLLAAPPAAVVTHDGPREVVLSRAETTLRAPVPESEIDTTGAGDRFCGGVLAALLAGATDPDALRAGIAAAHGA